MKLGEKQTLFVVKKVDFGVYLAESPKDTENRVLLPARQVPEGTAVGDPLEVFLYKDSRDRLIATTNTPKLVMGEAAELTVAQTGKIGAFLDWGLEKDLLLPFRQQVKKVKEGDRVLVSLYLDKSERLCATMNVYHNLQSDSPYHTGDQVTGRAYASSEEFGVFVAVDNRYSALIPKKELYGQVLLGEDVRARVTKVQPDGRLVLSIREKSCLQMQEDAEKILELLDSYDGVLPFNDKVSPAIILRETGMSKNEFKRAVGHLLKAGKIEITEKVIRKK
ncbi:MAG: RNA-binding protein [Lachnospiraceae bacterium]|nr:RNA-binding protein [Lachnospiraceae bacterium]